MAYEEWSSVEKVKKYQQKRYKHFDQKVIDMLEKSLVKNIFSKYNIYGKILDIPCGYGRFHPILNDFGEIHAADNGKLIAKFQEENVGLAKSTTVCDAADMPFDKNSFDAVFSIRLMQHIHDRGERIKIYKEFCRISKEWIIISLYVDTFIHNIFKKIDNKKAKITFLDNRTILSEFKEAGLESVIDKFVLPGLHGHKIYLTKIKKHR